MAFSRYKKRTYSPGQEELFEISRSKIDLFIECPRCFFLGARLDVKRPSLPGFTLNIAVDHLLKKEFDVHRKAKTQHPLCKKHNVSMVPFDHEDIDTWRHNFTGMRFFHKPTNLTVFGAVDDVWVDKNGNLSIVDYKATSKQDDPTLDGRWGDQYKRQMEVYQWLFENNGFKVNKRGYFVYVNGRKDLDSLDGKLEFRTYLIPYDGNSDWIEGVLGEIKKCLEAPKAPQSGDLCEHCPYRESAGKALWKNIREEDDSTEKKTNKQTTSTGESSNQQLF